MRKDYFISKYKNYIIISENPNNNYTTLEDINNIAIRYKYQIGQKIITSFGIETIKDIDKNYSTHHGYEWLITVKENSNQYKPCEIIGIFIKKYYNHSLINDLLLPRQHLGI